MGSSGPIPWSIKSSASHHWTTQNGQGESERHQEIWDQLIPNPDGISPAPPCTIRNIRRAVVHHRRCQKGALPQPRGEVARQRTKSAIRLLYHYKLLTREKSQLRFRPGRPPYVYRISKFGTKHLTYARKTAGFFDFYVLAEQKKDAKEFCTHARKLLRKALDIGYANEGWMFSSDAIESFISFYESSGDEHWHDWILAGLAMLILQRELLEVNETAEPPLFGKIQYLRRQFKLASDRLGGRAPWSTKPPP